MMFLFEIAQTMTALAGITMIMLGSAWLKRFLRGML